LEEIFGEVPIKLPNCQQYYVIVDSEDELEREELEKGSSGEDSQENEG